MVVKSLSVLMLITPLFHLFLLHFLKDKYRTVLAVVFYCVAFGVSVYLIIVKNEAAQAFAFCSVVSCLVSIGVKKIYYYILNAVIASIIEKISEAEVLSSLFVTNDEAYAITSKGYMVVQYKEEKYMLYENSDELPDEAQAIFSLLNPTGK